MVRLQLQFLVKFRFVVATILTLFTAHFVQAQSGISYHGKIVRPDGNPVNSASTQFRIQIKSPGAESCLLWEEQQTKDLSQTAGVFSITINDTSEPSLIANTLPFTIERVFSNKTPFTALTCSSGTTYTPSSSIDGRILQAFFRELPTDPWEQVPVLKINYVPLALNSVQLQGYLPTEFLKIDPYTNQTPISNAGVNTLLGLIAGTSSLYLKSTDSMTGDLGGTYGAGTVVGIRGRAVGAAAPVLGQVLKFDGTSWVPSADDTGGAPADASYAAKGVVQFDTSAAVSGVTVTAGVARLADTITAGGPTGSASVVPVITYDAKGRLTAVTTAAVNDVTKLPLAGGTMTGPINMGLQNITNATSIAATNFSGRNLLLNDNDTNIATIRAPVNLAADYALTLPTAAPTNGYVLSTDAGGQLSWIPAATGSVTSVTATAPVLSTTGATPVISLDTGLGANKVPQVGGTALGANGVVVANGTATALSSLNCAVNQVIKFDASGFAVCGADDAGAANAFVQNGNAFGAAAILGTNDNFNLNFEANNTTRMTIQAATGNVGIGTTNPTQALDVEISNNLNTGRVIARFGSTSGGRVEIVDENVLRPAEIVNGNTLGLNIGAQNGPLLLSAGDNGNGQSQERMRITGTGNVGIGTTNPAAKFELATNPFTETGDYNNFRNTAFYNAGTNNTGTLTNIVNETTTDGTGNKNNIIGVYNQLSHGSSGNLASAIGTDNYIRGLNGNGAITSAIGTRNVISNMNTASTFTTAIGTYTNIINSSTGSITNAYGLFVEDLEGTNSWGVYQVGASDRNYFAGNVGIGTTAPATKLDVSGAVRIGNDATACAAGLAGSLRYNGGAVEYCNGSAWQSFGVSGAGLTSLNGQTGNTQTFNVTATGLTPAINSATDVHTLSIPLASGAGVTSGTISKVDYDNFSGKLTSPLTTKGDLLVQNATVPDRLPVGTNGQILSANSATATGLEWVAPSTGDITSVVAGAGLTDGGLTGDVTLNVAAGNGILVAADSVAVDTGLGINKIPQVGGTALGANGVVIANGTGTALTSLNCLVNQVIKFDASGFATCAADDTGAANAFVNGGNTLGAEATIGTNDNFGLNLETNNTTRMAISNTGMIGINSAPNTTSRVNIYDYRSNSATGHNAIFADTFRASSVTNANTNISGNFSAYDSIDGVGVNMGDVKGIRATGGIQGFSGGTPSVTNVMGVDTRGAAFSGATATNVIGVNSLAQIDGSTTTNAYAFYGTVTRPSGTLTNGYGLYLGPIAGTNKWSVYASDASAPSHFAGNVGIGSGITAPSTALDINGATTMRGIASPTISPAGQGRIYFDSTANKFRVSQNGTAYTDLIPTGGTGDILNGGNTTGAAITIGTNDNFALNLEVNNSAKMRLDTNSNLSINGGITSNSNGIAVGGSTSSNWYAMAFGHDTVASGGESTTFGFETQAASLGQMSVGFRNLSTGTETNGSWVATDPLFVIGNANFAAPRSNALMVFKNSRTLFNGGTSTALPAGNAMMNVKGSTTDSTAAAFNATDSAGTSRLYVRNDGNVGIGTTSPGALLDLGTPGSTLGTLRLSGNTSGYVQLQPAAAAGSWNMTLPDNDGTAGQALVTDGSGVTSWASVPTSGGTFLAGDGTAALPTYSFSSQPNLGFYNRGSGRLGFASGGNLEFTLSSTDLYSDIPGGPNVSLDAGSNTDPVFSFRGDDDTGFYSPALGEIRFTSNAVDRMTILPSGNVGIGTTSSTKKMSVVTNTVGDGILIQGTSGPSLSISNGTYLVDIGLATTGAFYSNAAVNNDTVIRTGSAPSNGNLILSSQNATGGIVFATGSNDTNDTAKMKIMNNGNVGIGTTNPGALLDLGTPGTSLGTMRLSGNTSGFVQVQPAAAAGSWTMTLPTSAGTNGQVLSTNGSGVTSWITPSGGGSGDISNNGNTFGAAATIGTNDNFGLNLETNGATRMNISNTGNVLIGENPGVPGRFTLTTNSAAPDDDDIFVVSASNTATHAPSLVTARFRGTIAAPTAVQVGDSLGGMYITGFDGGTSKLAAGVVGYAENTFSTQVSASLRLFTTEGTNTNSKVFIAPNGFVGIGDALIGASSRLEVDGAITQRGMAAPALSPGGQGRIYFDSTSNKFRASQNGGAYADLLTSMSGFNANQAIIANGSGVATSFTCGVGQVLGFDASGFAVCTNVTGTGGFLNAGNSYGAAATLGTNDNFALNFETNGTPKMTILGNGFVGIGTTNPLSFFDKRATLTDTSVDTAFGSEVTINPAVNVTQDYYGQGMSMGTAGTRNISGVIFQDNNFFLNDTTGDLTEHRGYYSESIHNSSGNVSIMRGGAHYIGNNQNGTLSTATSVWSLVSNNSTGSITNAYGGVFEVLQPSGTITNSYGVYVGDVQGTNKFAFYAEDANADNYFAGAVGIGTTTPGAKLEVVGNLKVTNGRISTSVITDNDALAALTVDFTNSNTVRATSAAGACGTLNVTNTSEGAQFTLTILNATTSCTTIQWNGSATNVKLPSGYAGGASVDGIVYTFLDDGLTLWVSAVPF